MKLRPFQETLIERTRVRLREIRAALVKTGEKRGPRVLIQCPTGGGKTVLAAFITKGVVERGKRLNFLCHRDFLVDQTSKTYARLKLDHSFIAAGRWFNPYTPVHIGMVQSMRSRIGRLEPPDVCIWDEAHHISAAGWAAIMAAWPDATHIGLSATPVRLDGKGLDTHFDDLIIGPSVHWLIANGFLSDYIAYAPSSPDLTGLHTRMGDYVATEVDEVMDRAVIIGDMVRHYRDLARGKKAVYFCTSVAHSQHTAAAFNAAGFRWRHLDGTHSTWERKQAAAMMANGEIDGFCNVDLFGEGFDLAAQAEMEVTIEAVGLARPTQSLGLFMQQVGRVLRPKDYKAVILDHAGNIARHGLPDDERKWTLAGVDKQPSAVEQCSNCGATVSSKAAVCRHCGARLKERKESLGLGGRMVEEKDGDLHEVNRDPKRFADQLEEWQASSLQELIDIAVKRGYRNPEKWAGFLWTDAKRRRAAREWERKQQLNFFEEQRR